MERRIITTQLEENENMLENHLRPQYLSEYIGQEKAKEMNVARRTCGYIGTQFWNQGRTQEIKERVLHL